jgi:hypothetical protein
VQASIIQLIIIKVYSRRKILRGTSGFHWKFMCICLTFKDKA